MANQPKHVKQGDGKRVRTWFSGWVQWLGSKDSEISSERMCCQHDPRPLFGHLTLSSRFCPTSPTTLFLPYLPYLTYFWLSSSRQSGKQTEGNPFSVGTDMSAAHVGQGAHNRKRKPPILSVCTGISHARVGQVGQVGVVCMGRASRAEGHKTENTARVSIVCVLPTLPHPHKTAQPP